MPTLTPGPTGARPSSSPTRSTPGANKSAGGGAVRLALAAALVAAPARAADPPRNWAAGPEVREVLVLKQNWTEDEARWFYGVPQGSKLIPYDWFLHLERADAATPFRAADHVRELGYLARTPDAVGNPDGLPVGFAKDGEHLGLTCAACHTAQINYKGRAWLIDGAPTHGDFEELLRRLAKALAATRDDPAQFGRFAAKLGAATDAAKAKLKADLDAVAQFRAGYNARNLPGPGATRFGPGRVDAFGAIMNEAAVTIAGVPGNAKPADAPVSYPFLWDTPQHDFVQWNGSAPNRKATSALLRRLVGTEHVGALGRNAGEVLGVFGTMDASKQGPLLQLRGYPSSIHRANLIDIEESLRKLWSPEWPFGPLDAGLKAKGAALYDTHCVQCHERIQRDAPGRAVTAVMRAAETDPVMFTNFRQRTARTGPLEGRKIELFAFPPRRFGETAAAGTVLRHLVQRGVLKPDVNLLALVGRERDELGQALRELDEAVEYRVAGVVSEGFARLTVRVPFDHAAPADAPPVQVAYKARPLNGIWATAPYLHNGSVPNLDELLKPPADRSQQPFCVGGREFDPDAVGFAPTCGVPFNPKDRGNSNAGHDYARHPDGTPFTADERRQLLEYLKSL